MIVPPVNLGRDVLVPAYGMPPSHTALKAAGVAGLLAAQAALAYWLLK